MSVNKNKTIAYIRVSSQRQVDEGNSLEAQKRRIIQLAQFKGLSIAPEDFLIEKGVSAGIPLWERPMGRILRRKLLSGEYSNLIAMKLDRLFRITTDMLLTVQEVQDMGVRLLIADLGGEAIDTSTSTGRFMLTIFGGIAEMERGLISERTQEGMDQLKAQNKRFTESIFGWDVDVMECSYRIGMNKTSSIGWIGKLKSMVCPQLLWHVASTLEALQANVEGNGRGSL